MESRHYKVFDYIYAS